jgi:hypothetical protein
MVILLAIIFLCSRRYWALQQATQTFDQMMRECGLDEEVLLQEFQEIRRQEKAG